MKKYFVNKEDSRKTAIIKIKEQNVEVCYYFNDNYQFNEYKQSESIVKSDLNNSGYFEVR